MTRTSLAHRVLGRRRGAGAGRAADQVAGRATRRATGRELGRRRDPSLVLSLALVLVVLLIVTATVVALATAPSAAALRSGPDVAVSAGRGGPFSLLVAGASVPTDGGVGDGGPGGGGSGGGGSGGGAVADGGLDAAGPGATGYVPPVAGVDPPAGVEHPFDPPEEEWGAGHRGVDLRAAVGAPVLSPGPGVVTFAGQVARRGVVVVTHPDGLRTSLEPVAASVPVGTAVAAGTAVGVVEDGSDGTTPNHCAPGSCVHWGVRRGDRYIDPLSLLDRPPIVLLPDG